MDSPRIGLHRGEWLVGFQDGGPLSEPARVHAWGPFPGGVSSSVARGMSFRPAPKRKVLVTSRCHTHTSPLAGTPEGVPTAPHLRIGVRGGLDEKIPNGDPIVDFGGPQSTIESHLSRFDNTITDLSLSIAYLTTLPQI